MWKLQRGPEAKGLGFLAGRVPVQEGTRNKSVRNLVIAYSLDKRLESLTMKELDVSINEGSYINSYTIWEDKCYTMKCYTSFSYLRVTGAQELSKHAKFKQCQFSFGLESDDLCISGEV